MEAAYFTIYKGDQGAELVSTQNNTSWWPE